MPPERGVVFRRYPARLGESVEQRAGGDPMTAQNWLDELERLRKAATPGPWEAWRYNAGFVRISTCPLDPDDDEVIKVADSPDITASDAAYIVAACNAVPMLVEMLRIAVSLIEAQNAQRARKGEKMPEGDVMQLIFTLTEPKE